MPAEGGARAPPWLSPRRCPSGEGRTPSGQHRRSRGPRTGRHLAAEGRRAVVDDQNRARRLRGGGREARREDARGERPTREIMTRVSRSEKHRSAGRVRRRPVPRSCLRRTVDLSVVVFPMDFVFLAPCRLARTRATNAIFFLWRGMGLPLGSIEAGNPASWQSGWAAKSAYEHLVL